MALAVADDAVISEPVETTETRPANGVAAIKAANRLVSDSLAPLYWNIETDDFGAATYRSSYGRNVMPEDVLETLRSSSLFEPISFSVTIQTLYVDESDPNHKEMVATVRWQNRDLVHYKTTREKERSIVAYENLQSYRYARACSSRWSNGYSRYYGSSYRSPCYNYGERRETRFLERRANQVNKFIDEQAKQRKDFAEHVELHLIYNGPVSAKELVDKRRFKIVVQVEDVDLRPGIEDLDDVGPAIGIIYGKVTEVDR